MAKKKKGKENPTQKYSFLFMQRGCFILRGQSMLVIISRIETHFYPKVTKAMPTNFFAGGKWETPF